MNIQSTKSVRPHSPAKAKAKPEEAPKEQDITVKDVVTKAAFTAGGALGGTGLGVVTGLALSNVSGHSVFGQAGGAVGAVGGAIAGYVASNDGVSKESLARSVGSWAGASIASSAGMYAATQAGAYLVQNGASGFLGTSGALIGTAAGGLVGAAIPFIGAEGKGADVLKKVGMGAAGAGIGTFAGGAAQCMIKNIATSGYKEAAEAVGQTALAYGEQALPQLSHMLAPLPLMGGAAMALTALDLQINQNAYTPDHKGIRTAKHAGLATLAGYGGGAIIGGAIQGLTGNASYMLAAPITGGAVGALTALGLNAEDEHGDNNVYYKLAKTTSLTALGAGVGDAIGHGLSAVTGNSVYQTIGQASGAVNGLAAGLRASKIDDKNGLPIVTGLLSGGASGALLGAGISALSGQDIWNTVTPILGAATGGLTGFALALHKD